MGIKYWQEYLETLFSRVCPFIKPVGKNCVVEKAEDQCCPSISCPPGQCHLYHCHYNWERGPLSLEWPLAWAHPSDIMSSRAAHQTKLNYVCQHQLSCRLYNTNHSAYCTHKLICSSNSNFHHLKPSLKSSCAKIKIVRANFPKESVFTWDNEPRNCEVLKWR